MRGGSCGFWLCTSRPGACGVPALLRGGLSEGVAVCEAMVAAVTAGRGSHLLSFPRGQPASATAQIWVGRCACEIMYKPTRSVNNT